MLMDGEGSFAVAALVCPVGGRSRALLLLLLLAPGKEGKVWVAAVLHCWVLPRWKVSVLEGQKQSIEEYWQVYCLLVLMHFAFRIHQP